MTWSSGMSAGWCPSRIWTRSCGASRLRGRGCHGFGSLIAGDGDERRALEARVTELGLEGRVEFLGWRSDLPALYQKMDLFVLTSINEGTPVSLIEAMAAGVPVVATSVGGVPDVIEDGVTGVLIPPRQPEAVASAIVSAVARARPNRHDGRARARERARSLRQCPARSGDRSHVSTDPARDARRNGCRSVAR